MLKLTEDENLDWKNKDEHNIISLLKVLHFNLKELADGSESNELKSAQEAANDEF